MAETTRQKLKALMDWWFPPAGQTAGVVCVLLAVAGLTNWWWSLLLFGGILFAVATIFTMDNS